MSDEEIDQGPPEKGEVTLSIVVTRKDGTVEDLGVVARGKTDWTTEE